MRLGPVAAVVAVLVAGEDPTEARPVFYRVTWAGPARTVCVRPEPWLIGATTRIYRFATDITAGWAARPGMDTPAMREYARTVPRREGWRS